MNHSKFCPSCRETRPAEEFYRDTCRKDGLMSRCKTCHLQYCRNRWANDITVRERHCLSRREWHKAHPGYNKELRAKNVARDSERKRIRYANNPEKFRARETVYRLVSSGELPRAKDCCCTTCGKQAAHYHHHRGYAREHWEDVIPVCVSCHMKHDSPHDWKL